MTGVYTTAVGNVAGYTPIPTYQEGCTGLKGHNEAVFVLYDPIQIGFDAMLQAFWQARDPTQAMRQGNDQGIQYRSGIYYYSERQYEQTSTSRQLYQQKLHNAGYTQITTEIVEAGPFYYAEDYHQQYREKNRSGYCGLGGTGVCY